ncbi:MAG: TadE family type IV pilus minor pilin [Sciscionella sp.]
MTVEAAVALSAFVAVLAMVLSGVSAVLDQIRCTDAAREAARLVARGDSARATDAVHRIAPTRATLSVQVNGDEVTVTVAVDDVTDLLPGLDVGARAYAVAEPAVSEPAVAEPGAGGTTATGPPAAGDGGP